MGKLWENTAFVFFFAVLCLAFIGLKIAVGAIAKSAGGKNGKKAKSGEADGAADEVLNETVTISRAEYENLLRIKAEYERSKK